MVPFHQLFAQNELPLPQDIPHFINLKANTIIYPKAIEGFTQKLRKMEQGDTTVIRILHIGDSHIYADLFTGMTRQLFQKRFGIGGAKQLLRYKLSDFQDTTKTLFIDPYLVDSINRRGILYDVAGTNGAEYLTYNQNYLFFKETKLLKPDLVIISLGTNEAFGYLNRSIFENNIDAFISQIRTYNPNVEILITTPGDAMKRKRYHNPNIDIVRKILIDYAKVNNTALWDFYTVMGGTGSMKKWFVKGLAQRDKVHLSKEGYLIQGFLFFNAMMNELDKPTGKR
jgi:lysophospholipase L1-like esterase